MRKRADKAVVKSQVSDAVLIEKRREQIVAAAIELFSKQGYDRTTMLDIARKARISVGLIYQYAQTKEDVLFLSLMSALDSYKREILPASPDDPPIEALWKALDAYARIIDRRRAAAVLAYRSTKSLSPAQRHTIMQLEIETNELLAERVQARLAGPVGRVPGFATERAARGHVHDPASGLPHVLDGAPGHVGGPGEVDRQGVAPRVLPLVVGHLGDRVPVIDPGVVHQHIQAAQVAGGSVHHLPDGLGVGQVGTDDGVTAARQSGQHLAR